MSRHREHYSRQVVSVAAYCRECGKQTQHRVDDGRRGPCLDCIDRMTAEHFERNHKPIPTGSFFCPDCGKETLHRMDNDGWKKGECLECIDRLSQLDLFA